MMDNSLALVSATELSAMYRLRRASPVEATRAVLAQIAALNPVLNAFCWLDPDAAIASARDSEARWHRGEPLSAIDGVPTTVKDLSLTRGWPTRRGSRAIRPEGPWVEDAPSVARMREAGAVLLGKTTVPEFGATGSTKSELCGITRNPWDPAKTPGGSSGGSAASLAAGMGTIALASDAAGSIRTPASVTGVFGLKTTFGRVADYPSSYLGALAVIGPMTRTVADAALCMSAIARLDVRDSYALPDDGADFLGSLDGGVSGLRVAFSPTLGFAEVDPEVASLVETGARRLEELGAIVEIVENVFADPAEILRDMMLPGLANAFRVFGFTDAEKAMMHPRFVEYAEKGAKVSLIDFLAAREKCEHLGARMRAFHQRYDLLVTPTLSIPAINADEDEPSDPRYRKLKNWKALNAAFNLTKQPAASVPIGVTAGGLPVGMQVVGPLYADALVLRACHALEVAYPFARPDLDAVCRFPIDDAIPRGIASMNEARSAMAAA
jgi:aspartyl-tRNA(Asn)/glutamyl-tRNA(Gln) amidotransferase subunit A